MTRCCSERASDFPGTALNDRQALVDALVARVPCGGREREELYQQGCYALIKALSRYVPEEGTRFSAFAARVILSDLRVLCRSDAPAYAQSQRRIIRGHIRKAESLLTTALHREPTIAELASALRVSPPELAMTLESVAPLPACPVRLLPEGLPPSREARRLMLLRLRYGLTQAEAGRRLGLTQVQVSRRESTLRDGFPQRRETKSPPASPNQKSDSAAREADSTETISRT